MKSSALMLAFIVSTAIHVGALTSNLLHVNAESVFKNSTRTVRLHVVVPAIRTLPTPSPEEVDNEIAENPRSVNSEILERNTVEQSEILTRETPVVKTFKTALTANQPVAETLPTVNLPDPPPDAITPSVDEFPEEWSEVIQPVVAESSGNEAQECDDCSASLAAIPSLIPNRVEMSRPEVGVTCPAVISLASKPKYPRYSRLHKEEGTTVLSVEILPDGKLGDVEVVNSSGFRRLDQAAVKGIRKADLVPAMKDGQMVASVKRISIRFDLEDWGE